MREVRGGKAKINFKRGSNRTLYRTCKKLHAASTERPRVFNDVISRALRKYSISISLPSSPFPPHSSSSLRRREEILPRPLFQRTIMQRKNHD